MLNWLTRYGPVRTVLDRLGGGESLSILDVGCGSIGLSSALPNVRFAGCDVAFASVPPTTMVAVQGAPGSLPFMDRSFDVVVCVDVLEHVPPHVRTEFVAELARVAAGRVLLCVPLDEAATWLDEHVRAQYEVFGCPAPDWLTEHIEHGLPSPDDVDDWVQAVDEFTPRPWQMVNGWLSAIIAQGDVLPGLASAAAREWIEQGTRWLDVLQAGEFGSGVRKGISLERDYPSKSLVDPGAPLSSVISAVRCARCGSRYSLVETGVAACTACHAALHQNERDVWVTIV